jgi:Domain of unknown function (DUF1996)
LSKPPFDKLHRKRRTTGTAALVAALLGGLVLAAMASVATAPSASAKAKIKCKELTGTAAVDPIVHHNQPVSDMQHMHQFFGNNHFLSLPNPNEANYEDLVSQGTNCENAADTAGYWTPVLRYKDSGETVPTRAFTAYYRSWDFKDTGEGVPLPDDVRLIASKHNWTCGQFESVQPSQSIPDCSMADGSPGSTLTAHIDFPSCWDGVKPNHSKDEVGDTRDDEHFAYRVGKSCPPGFPVKTVALRETIQFAYTGKGADVELSSDAMMGTSDGQSLHGDFWNAWEPAGFASMVRNCINPGGQFTTAECG